MATLAFIKGLAPQLSVEFARRSIPTSIRPSFQETEAMIRGARAEAAAPAALRRGAAPPADEAALSAGGTRHGQPTDSSNRRHPPQEGPRRTSWRRVEVAYADFVTALMALFIVLWLVSSSEKVKKAVQTYFQDRRAPVNWPARRLVAR